VRDPDSQPFHPKHLIPAWWGFVVTLVGGFILFGAGVFYQRTQGPQRVVITNPDTTRRILIVGDTVSREYLVRVIQELQALRRAQATAPPDRSEAPGDNPNPIRLDAFSFPPVVKGSLVRDFSTWGHGTCPETVVRAAKDLRITATLRLGADTARLSPLNVNIIRRQDAKNFALISEAWYDLYPRNLLVVPAPAAPGDYILEYGVYARDQVNTEYPPFYRRACSFSVR